MLPLPASLFPVNDPFSTWFTLFSTPSWIVAQAILHKPRMWQACTSRHSFDVNCLFDLKIWNQETTELCYYWSFFFLCCYFYVGHLAPKPLQLCPCLPGSPSPQFLPMFVLPLCDIYPNLLFQHLSQSSFPDLNSQNSCASYSQQSSTGGRQMPTLPHCSHIFSECANCICPIVCF